MTKEEQINEAWEIHNSHLKALKDVYNYKMLERDTKESILELNKWHDEREYMYRQWFYYKVKKILAED